MFKNKGLLILTGVVDPYYPCVGEFRNNGLTHMLIRENKYKSVCNGGLKKMLLNGMYGAFPPINTDYQQLYPEIQQVHNIFPDPLDIETNLDSIRRQWEERYRSPIIDHIGLIHVQHSQRNRLADVALESIRDIMRKIQ